MPSGSTSTWNFAGGAPPWPGTVEVDLDQHRGAADAHGRDRRVDLHVAMLGGRRRRRRKWCPATRLSSDELFDPLGS